MAVVEDLGARMEVMEIMMDVVLGAVEEMENMEVVGRIEVLTVVAAVDQEAEGAWGKHLKTFPPPPHTHTHLFCLCHLLNKSPFKICVRQVYTVQSSFSLGTHMTETEVSLKFPHTDHLHAYMNISL